MLGYINEIFYHFYSRKYKMVFGCKCEWFVNDGCYAAKSY